MHSSCAPSCRGRGENNNIRGGRRTTKKNNKNKKREFSKMFFFFFFLFFGKLMKKKKKKKKKKNRTPCTGSFRPCSTRPQYRGHPPAARTAGWAPSSPNARGSPYLLIYLSLFGLPPAFFLFIYFLFTFFWNIRALCLFFFFSLSFFPSLPLDPKAFLEHFFRAIFL